MGTYTFCLFWCAVNISLAVCVASYRVQAFCSWWQYFWESGKNSLRQNEASVTNVVKRVLTGTRPSGVPHLGNYFGAFKNAIELQNNGQELFFFLADYHALNSVEYGPSLREQSLSMTATLLSLGLDPRKSNF